MLPVASCTQNKPPEKRSHSFCNWYLYDNLGDFSLRIQSGMRLGEMDNGLLALDEVKHQWIRFYINANGELWVSTLDPQIRLQTDNQNNLLHRRLFSGCQLKLPNNDLLLSDHPLTWQPSSRSVVVVKNCPSDKGRPVEEPVPLLSDSNGNKGSFVDKLTAEIKADAILDNHEPEITAAAQEAEIPISANVPKKQPSIGVGLSRTATFAYFCGLIAIGALTYKTMERKTINPTSVQQSDLTAQAKTIASPDQHASKREPEPEVFIESRSIESSRPIGQLSTVMESPNQDLAPDKPDWRLQKAKQRIEQNKIIEPFQDSAVFYLRLLLSVQPENSEALSLLDNCVTKLLGAAKQAFASGNYYEARNLLEEIVSLDPSHLEATALLHQWLKN